ncbi:hypothetical protein [Streptomyces sp. 4R-3d]|uniref:hypothetical protein n=1 Tax=Streptomyces sp. 4R-3d TaxID=2559605 RepID=UPI001071D810|nr:hypothetical protein [Streptomyces sp. 4R-3d]TFI30138.1 hypothetical protein E4P36_05150 [Streptomyces sp. 4R-3d]
MTTWTATRGDLKKFLRDVASNPGKTYFSVVECVQPGGNISAYQEIVFKPSRLWVGTWGHHGAQGVLSLYGPITDVKPNVRPLFDGGGKQHAPNTSVAEPAKPAKKRILARR